MVANSEEAVPNKKTVLAEFDFDALEVI